MTELNDSFDSGPPINEDGSDIEADSKTNNNFDAELYDSTSASREDLSAWDREHPEGKDDPDFVDVAEVILSSERKGGRQRPQVDGQISIDDFVKQKDLEIINNPYAVDLSDRHKAISGLMDCFNKMSRFIGMSKYVQTEEGYQDLLNRYGSRQKVEKIFGDMKESYAESRRSANQFLDILMGDEANAKLIDPSFDRAALKKALASDLYNIYGCQNGNSKKRQSLVKKLYQPKK